MTLKQAIAAARKIPAPAVVVRDYDREEQYGKKGIYAPMTEEMCDLLTDQGWDIEVVWYSI